MSLLNPDSHDLAAPNVLTVQYRPIAVVAPYAGNARTHSKRQIRQIADSIQAFGFTNPILIDRNNNVIAGHARLEAAKLRGMKEVPTLCLENLTEDQLRAYVIADNRLAEKAGWDREILAVELQHLLSIDNDFDITITGFEIPEIDLILAESSDTPPPEDEFLCANTGPPVTQSGDLWLLSKHRLLCGNTLRMDSFFRLMSDHRANVIFTDPPFNVRIDGHATGNGAIHHREFDMAAGEMSEAEFTAFLRTSLGFLAQYSCADSVHFICMDWRHVRELSTVGQQVFDSLLNVCVWVKDNGGMGSFYRSRHELIFVYRNGTQRHRNNIQLGKFGRDRTNVWQYPGVNTMSKQCDEGNLLALHPTVKPIAMVADALLDCSAPGDLVVDAFLGSGTTLMAAERVGRICHGMEIDPAYIDIAIRRWQRYTGESAMHADKGETFDALAAAMEVSDVER